jgi:hypothetical protein
MSLPNPKYFQMLGIQQYLASQKAVSAEIKRLPLRILVMRPEGTPNAKATLFERPRADISHFKIRPG